MTNGRKVNIYLPPAAAQRLFALAQDECRRPNEQARYILLRALLGDDAQPTPDNIKTLTATAQREAVSA